MAEVRTPTGQKRCRFLLARLVASLQKSCVLARVPDIDAHRLIPAVGKFGEWSIKRGT